MDQSFTLRRAWPILLVILALALLLSAQMTTSAGAFFSSPISPLPTPTVFESPLPMRVSPPFGAEGEAQQVEIHGVGFASPSEVYLNDVPLGQAEFVNPFLLKIGVPGRVPAATYDVKVCSTPEICGVLPAGYRVLAPNAPDPVRMIPAKGYNDDPAAVLVVGRNFRPGMRMWLGNTELTGVTVIGPAAAVAVVPARMTPDSYTLTCSNLDTANHGVLDQAYTVLARDLDDLSAGEEDLWFDPLTPRVGHPQRIGLTVHRAGGAAPLSGAKVVFKAHSGGQARVLAEAALPDIPLGPGATAVASTTWLVDTKPGLVYLTADIVPGDGYGEITTANNHVSRSVMVLPAAEPPPPLPRPHLLLNDGSRTTTSRELLLTVSVDDASAANRVATAYVVERVFSSAAREWVTIQSTGWVSNTGPLAFQMSDRGGLHFFQAWVADRYGNVSPASAIERIVYLPADEPILAGEAHVYRLDLDARQTLHAELTSFEGDADLYLWGPDDKLAAASDAAGLAPDEMAYTAAASGTYQLEVRGYASSRYFLAYKIAPGDNGLAALRLTGEKTQPNAPAVPVNAAPAAELGITPPDVQAKYYAVFLPAVLRDFPKPVELKHAYVYIPLIMGPPQEP